ncbi:MAG: ABC transporter substrate-binding protein [Microthrixaceae bacterium]
MRAAVTEINHRGGVLGEPIRLLADAAGTGTADDVTAGAVRLVAEGADVVIGGSDASVTEAAFDPLVNSGVVMISPLDTDPRWTGAADRGLFFRTAPSAMLAAKVVADSVADAGRTRVVVVVQSGSPDAPMEGVLPQRLEVDGVAVLKTEHVTSAATRDTDATRILGLQPDSILVVAEPGVAGPLIAALRHRGPSSGAPSIVLTPSASVTSLESTIR